MQDKWLEDRVAYIRGLKSPNDHQRLLLLLNDKKDATNDDRRKLVALIHAEKAADRAQRAKASVAKIVNAEKLAERKNLSQKYVATALKNGQSPTNYFKLNYRKAAQ